jgi:hypothetical protein
MACVFLPGWTSSGRGGDGIDDEDSPPQARIPPLREHQAISPLVLVSGGPAARDARRGCLSAVFPSIFSTSNVCRRSEAYAFGDTFVDLSQSIREIAGRSELVAGSLGRHSRSCSARWRLSAPVTLSRSSGKSAA